MKRPASRGKPYQGPYDHPEYREVSPTKEWWVEVGLDVLKASLVAALGILVREAADRISRPRGWDYDPYDDM